MTLGLVDDAGLQRNVRAGGYSKLRSVAPGRSERLWVRYAVPPDAVQGLPFAPTHLTVMSALHPDRIGWISLSRTLHASSILPARRLSESRH